MTKELFVQAITKFTLGVICVGLLIFGASGTMAFWNGWLLMSVLFVPIFIAGIVMMIKNPALLKKRLNAKENQSNQGLLIKLSGLMFLAGFIIAGLNFRFNWHILSKSTSIVAAIVFLHGYLLFAQVLRQNAYLSRTIEVQENQHVIDTGLYAVVRHPMYTATVLMFLSMPLILGSLHSFVVFLIYPFIVAKRIKHEEAFLEKELKGYRAYQKKVKYRLMPFVW